MAEFVLKLKDLGEDGKDYTFPMPRSWLERSLHGCEARVGAAAEASVVGEISLHAQRNGEEVLLRGRVRTRVLLVCSRCLEDAPIEVDAELVSLQLPGSPPEETLGEEVELLPEEADRDWYQGEEIVLDALVREHILLEFPMQPLCSESCPGIEVPAHVRGPERLDHSNEDSWLAALGALRGRVTDRRDDEE